MAWEKLSPSFGICRRVVNGLGIHAVHLPRTQGTSMTILTPSLQKQLSSFATLSENFAKAYLELFEMYQHELSFPQRTAPIYEKIRKMGVADENSADANSANGELEHLTLKLLFSLRSLQISSHHDQDIEAIKRHKDDVAVLLEKIHSPAIQQLAERVIQLIETDYFTHLAIDDRKEFLSGTADYFFTVADETIESVIA